MQQILQRIISQVDQAKLDALPSENFYIEEFFSPDTYALLLSHLPEEALYQWIEHPDAILPNGRRTRKILDLTDATLDRFPVKDRAFWQEMKTYLSSEKLIEALVTKFANRLQLRFGHLNALPEMRLVPIFYRDYPGYYITEHTDAPYKIATMQIYLPPDHSQIHLGTSFHLKKPQGFQWLKTNAFKPNSAYGFVRTEDSWHSVKQMGEDEKIRDTLALTLYVKGQEYQSKW